MRARRIPRPPVKRPSRICSIEGCLNPKDARGLCVMHYARWKRTGITDDQPSDEERFWSYVDAGDCWLWTGSLVNGGYGQAWRDGRHVVAHKVAWEYLVGEVPEGMVLDHLCRIRNCVNPDHLRVVTQRENLYAGYGIGSKRYSQRHLPNGLGTK